MTVRDPIVQEHKASGEVWRRVTKTAGRDFANGSLGLSTVRIQREGKQRIIWLAYWRDPELWRAIR